MVGGAFVELVEELKGAMSIQIICGHMSIPRSTYYRWKNNSNKTLEKDVRDQAIGQLCATHKFRSMAIERLSLYFQEPVKRQFRESCKNTGGRAG